MLYVKIKSVIILNPFQTCIDIRKTLQLSFLIGLELIGVQFFDGDYGVGLLVHLNRYLIYKKCLITILSLSQ